MASRDPNRERQWQSGQTISAFCKLRNLSKPTFGYWQRKLGFGRRMKPRSPAVTFVPMSLISDQRVKVVLPSGVTLKLPGANVDLTIQLEQLAFQVQAGREYVMQSMSE